MSGETVTRGVEGVGLFEDEQRGRMFGAQYMRVCVFMIRCKILCQVVSAPFSCICYIACQIEFNDMNITLATIMIVIGTIDQHYTTHTCTCTYQCLRHCPHSL